MKIFWKIFLLLTTCQQTLSLVRIAVINNTIFDPINTNYIISNLSNIQSRSSCICQCYEISNCIIVNYYGILQECILFSAPLQLEQLHAISISENAAVIIIDSRNYIGQ